MAFFKRRTNKIQVVEIGSHEIGVDNTQETFNDAHQLETLKSFTEDTTLHGARFLLAGNIFRRLLWTLLLVASLSYCMYEAYRTVDDFNNKPYNTKITTKDRVEVFPAVTLCNFNIVNTRKYRDWVRSMNLSDEVVEKKLNDVARLLRRANISNNETKRRSPELFIPPPDIHGVQMADYQQMFGHDIEEMLLPNSEELQSCAINGMLCGAKNFTLLNLSSYGKCYTFNSGQDKAPLKATLAIRDSGLKLRLNIERDSYIKNPHLPFTGVMILIHDQKSLPFVAESGVAIQPGTHTVCSVKQKRIKNLQSPFATNCTERELAIFNNTHYVYTKQACVMQCLNEFIVKRCKCRQAVFGADVPICAPIVIVNCVFPQHEIFGISEEKRQCDKNCPQPCHQVEYETSFSYSGLQRDTLADYLIERVNGTDHMHKELSAVKRMFYEPLLNMTRYERKEYIDNNIVSLDIYYKDLSYDEVEQTPVFQLWNLIGTLGGNFGLFLGMSLLTLMEFVDFAFRRIFKLLCRA